MVVGAMVVVDVVLVIGMTIAGVDEAMLWYPVVAKAVAI